MDPAKLESLIVRLEAAVSKLEGGHGGSLAVSHTAVSGDGAASGSTSPSYLDYCAWVDSSVKSFVDASTALGDDISKIGDLFHQVIDAQKCFILLASKHSKPSDSDLAKILEPQVKAISAVTEFREASRRSKYFNHLSAVSEAIPAVSWICVSPTPMPYVKDMSDAAMFYTNRVLKEYRETSPEHVAWTKLLLGMLRELIAYIKQHHTTGLTWNAQGSPAKLGAGKPKVGPKPRAAGGPPPPPPGPGAPPPPPSLEGLPKAAAQEPEVDRSELFAKLNSGAGVTAGLKKVTSDMQTHKNPTLRTTSQVNSTAKPYSAPKPKAFQPKAEKVYDPVFELDGKKWMIEHQKKNKGLQVDGNMKQTVYIYKCQDSVVTVNGKVNSIILDTCKKCAVVFDDSVAGIEIINCQGIKSQVTGKCPIINVDKTDGFQMYLSKDSIGVEIITAKVSEINIMIPDGDDYIEKAVVEQFKTMWNPATKQMETTPVDICG